MDTKKEKTTKVVEEVKSVDKKSDTKVLKSRWTLTRKEDKKTWQGNEIDFIVWKTDGTFGGKMSSPVIGSSLALDLEFGVKSEHITTEIKKIVQNDKQVLKFETLQYTYELVSNS